VSRRCIQARADDTHETKGNARATLALPEAEWLAYRLRIFLKGTSRSQLFFSAHAPSHRLWRATIISPVGVLATRDFGILRLLPNPEALLRSYMAIYEMLGEPARVFLSATHLRRE